MPSIQEEAKGCGLFKTKPVSTGFLSLPSVGIIPNSLTNYKISWEIHGTGPIHVVLVMGFMGTIGDWEILLNELMKNSEEYTVVMVDNRGAGASTGGLPALYSTKGMAADISKVLTHIGWTKDLRSFHICGISMGGMIALELAHLLATHVRSLTLMVTCAKFVQSPTNQPIAMGKTSQERAAAVVLAGCSDEDYLSSHNPQFPEFSTNRDRIRARYARRMESNSKLYPRSNAYNLTLYGQLAGIMRHNVSPDRLQHIKEMIPDILVMGGSADKIIHPQCSKDLEKALDARAVYFEKAGHNILDEACEEEVLKETIDMIKNGEKRWSF